MTSLPTLIDSHCHIVFRNFDDDLDEVAARWREAGVEALLHACVEPSEIPAIRALADRFPEMRYSVGVHPLDTKHWQDDTVSVLRRAALEDDRVVAIGELGLDLFRDKNLDEQIALTRTLMGREVLDKDAYDSMLDKVQDSVNNLTLEDF